MPTISAGAHHSAVSYTTTDSDVLSCTHFIRKRKLGEVVFRVRACTLPVVAVAAAAAASAICACVRHTVAPTDTGPDGDDDSAARPSWYIAAAAAASYPPQST